MDADKHFCQRFYSSVHHIQEMIIKVTRLAENHVARVEGQEDSQ